MRFILGYFSREQLFHISPPLSLGNWVNFVFEMDVHVKILLFNFLTVLMQLINYLLCPLLLIDLI